MLNNKDFPTLHLANSLGKQFNTRMLLKPSLHNFFSSANKLLPLLIPLTGKSCIWNSCNSPLLIYTIFYISYLPSQLKAKLPIMTKSSTLCSVHPFSLQSHGREHVPHSWVLLEELFHEWLGDAGTLGQQYLGQFWHLHEVGKYSMRQASTAG